METTIRFATPTDIPVIEQLAEATWSATYSSILSKEQVAYMFDVIYTPEALATQMQQGQQFILLYEQETPVGFASFSEMDAQLYKLNKLYLLPSCQGKGFGKRLLEAVEKEVTKRGASDLCLNVNRYNKAKEFYERCGYSIYKEDDIAIGPYWMNDYVMRKALQV